MLAYGGDYTPEQWPEEVWAQDVELMRAAGVNLVSVGMFNWALVEPAEGRYTFEWLDRVLDLLHGAGIRVDLGTPTAVPPPWFIRRHPGARLVDRAGHVLGQGGRQSFCPSSPDYARASRAIAESSPEIEDANFVCPECKSPEIVLQGLGEDEETDAPDAAVVDSSFHWICDACGHEWTDDGIEQQQPAP